MRIIGIIPARMGSSRFPGKPLAPINGIPMIGHVYYRSKMCFSLDEVYIATCDEEIRQYASLIKAPCIMTSSQHERATDRTAEAMLKIEQMTAKKVDIVVMIQGDEPMLHPEMIAQSLDPMVKDQSVNVVNLMSPLESLEEEEDANEVKVVVDRSNNALYFSREPIPSRKKEPKDVFCFKQVCIIPFRRDFLLLFNRLESTSLEKIESVDMLRVLEHGYKVKMALTAYKSYSVDTPQDLEWVTIEMRSDKLLERYGALAQV